MKQRSGSRGNLLHIADAGKSLVSAMLKRSNSYSSLKQSPKPVHVERTPSYDAFATVVESLARVACSPHMSISMVSFGFIPPLINILAPSAASTHVQLCALRALAHLASHREHVVAIHDAGAIPALVAILVEGSAELKVGALEVV